MKKTFLFISVLVAIFFANSIQADPSVYKKKKYFGPIPLSNINFSFGFIDGPDDEYLTDHLAHWAQLQGGKDYFEKISTSPYASIGYEKMVSPFHFFRGNISFCYLKNESIGDFIKEIPDADNIALDIKRQLKIYYLSFDLGFAYYLVEPKVRALAPYVAGGFSGVIPMVKLETDAVDTDTGASYDLPDENLDQTTFQSGLHIEFGMRYLISNRIAAGMEGKYQMSQSKFDIHNANFDLDYSGLSLALNFYYYF
ncbi:MAG: hypothetical protein KAV42_06195 [Candidatus Krumholzibacteria bacterium]|nr:hypothetical protein [Candidatus Krumholzibacteria bacterium]